MEKEIKVSTLKSEFSELGACFINVHKQVKKFGGSEQKGWLAGNIIFPEMAFIQIWTHHCIWLSPEGVLHDITPQMDFFNRIILFPEKVKFVPDNDAALRVLENGMFKVQLEKYEPLKDLEKVHKAIECLKIADAKLDAGDTKGEEYWTTKAGKVLGGWMVPYGDIGLKRPFTF